MNRERKSKKNISITYVFLKNLSFKHSMLPPSEVDDPQVMCIQREIY